RALALTAAAAVLALLPGQAAMAVPEAQTPVGSFIVTLTDDASTAPALQRHRVAATHRFEHVLNGFAAPLTKRQLAALQRDPAVAHIEPNAEMRVMIDQLNPPSWGLDRIDQRFLPLNNRYSFNNPGRG